VFGPYKGGMTPLRPDLMTPAERLDEIAEILAVGLLRRKPRGYWALCALASPRRMLVALELAEGEELETNILQVLLRIPAC
jgi:hypothetical protein